MTTRDARPTRRKPERPMKRCTESWVPTSTETPRWPRVKKNRLQKKKKKEEEEMVRNPFII